MTQRFTNAARAALSAPIGAGDTSLTIGLTVADLFPAANTGTDPVNTPGKDWFKIVLEDVNHNYEIIHARTRTLGSGVISNLLRGQEGTTAISFAAGSTIVGLRITAEDHENALELSSQATVAGKNMLFAADADAQAQLIGGALQKNVATAFTTAGSGTAYAITPTPAITAYVARMAFDVNFHVVSGNDPTLQISGVATPPNLVKQLADGSFSNVKAGDIPAGHRSRVVLISPTQALVERLLSTPYAIVATNAYTAVAGGSADAITADLTPDILAWTNGLRLTLTGCSANTSTTPTFNPDGLGTKTIVLNGNRPLMVGDMPPIAHLEYNSTYDALVLMNPLEETENLIITVSDNANARTITLQPCVLTFRSSTLTSSQKVKRRVPNAITMTLSAGSTLGTSASQQSDIAVEAIDNSGTVELALSNFAGGLSYDEMGLVSTTAEGGGGGADSATTRYSTNARSNVIQKFLGIVRSTQVTPGNWATPQTLIQTIGALGLSGVHSLGYSQKWQNVTGSRASGTTYTNTTGRPIMVSVEVTRTSDVARCAITVDGVNVANAYTGTAAAEMRANVSAIVPPGSTYSASAVAGSIALWTELR